MKKTAFALALVLLSLIWGQPALASDREPLSLVPQNAPSALAARQDTLSAAPSCPIEEGALLFPQADFGWRQPSLAYAATLGGMTLLAPSEDQPASLSVGAWFMGLGLVVFIISRKRFRS